MHSLKTLLLASLTTLLSLQAMGQEEGVTQSQNITLRVIPKDAFCKRLKTKLSQYGQERGFDTNKSILLANKAANYMVDEFREGRATDFIKATNVEGFREVDRPADDLYLPVANYIQMAMGFDRQVTLALSVGELRFIPYAQQGMELVVIAQNAAPLSPNRAKAVLDVAKRLNIRISVLWVGERKQGKEVTTEEEAKALAYLASLTGGYFTDLSGSANPCGEIL